MKNLPLNNPLYHVKVTRLQNYGLILRKAFQTFDYEKYCGEYEIAKNSINIILFHDYRMK